MRLMNIFGRPGAMASAPAERDASDDRWFSGIGGARSQIGVTVTTEIARRVPVVRDCLKTLADPIAGLERGVFRRTGPDETVRADDHPVLSLLANPNQRQSSFEFMYSIVDDLCAEGDFFAERRYSADGQLSELHRLPPSRVVTEELWDGSLRYRVTHRNGAQRALLEDEVWHIPLPPLTDNFRGTSPILHDGLEAVAVAIALQRYANILFTNDATPPYVLALPEGQDFDSEDSKKNFLSAFARWVTGKNRHRPGILPRGIKMERMGLDNEEAQFIETRKELWLDLTRLWKVPPHMVGILDRATFSNIEQQSLEFVMHTLGPILNLIESSISKHLIDEPDAYFEFDVQSLLRGDIKTRYEAFAIGRQWGWLSVNDILRAEKRNGIGPAGDRRLEPMNMVPVGSEMQRDPNAQAGVQKSIAFLRESVARNGGRPRLEVVKDVA